MTKRSLLLVDGDAKSLRVLEVSLKKAGFNVTAAESGPAALASLRNFIPDLVISDTQMPEMDGYAFCREFKSNPEWANIPFIFLTAQTEISDKIRGLELGVDDYLTKPIYIKEILTRVRILLQKHDRANFEQKKESNTRFAGRLNDMGVVDLIQTIEVSRKTGVIHFRADEKHQATMFFKDGKVIDAEAGHLQGEDAVYRLLTWNEGEFEALFRPVRRRSVIDIPSQSLLMEGMRRLDEWGRLQEQLPPLTQKFEVVYDELWDRLAELPDDINHILRLFDTRRTLQEVIDGSNIGDLEAVEVISKLYFEGIIVETDPTTGLKSGSYPVEELRLHRATPPAEDPEPEPVPSLEETLAPEHADAYPDPGEDTEQGMDLAPYGASEEEGEVFNATTPQAPEEPADSTEPTEPSLSVGEELPDASAFDEPFSGLLEQAITDATPVTPSSSTRTTAKGIVAEVARVSLKKRPSTEDEAAARQSRDFSKPKTKPFPVLTHERDLRSAEAEAEETTNKLAPVIKSSDGGLNAATSGSTESAATPRSKAANRPSVEAQEYEAEYDELGGEDVASELESQEVTVPIQAKVKDTDAEEDESEEVTVPVQPKVRPKATAEVYKDEDDDKGEPGTPALWYAAAAAAAGLLLIVAVKGLGDDTKKPPPPSVAIASDASAGIPPHPPAVPDARIAVVVKPVDAGTPVSPPPDARIAVASKPPPDARPKAQVEILSSEEQIKALQAAARKKKRSGDRLGAIELLDEALTIRRSSTSLFMKSQILLDMGDSRAAAAVAQEVTRSAPRRSQGWRILGLARFESKDYPGARTAFTRYLELAPSAKDAEDVRTLLESL